MMGPPVSGKIGFFLKSLTPGTGCELVPIFQRVLFFRICILWKGTGGLHNPDKFKAELSKAEKRLRQIDGHAKPSARMTELRSHYMRSIAFFKHVILKLEAKE